MEVTPSTAYVFYKPIEKKGREKIFLYSGFVKGSPRPSGLRWKIHSIRNPFPIRNGTWFEGFSTSEMIRSIEAQGYVFVTSVPLN